MNNITFNLGNGNLVSALAGQDHYSGLLLYCNQSDFPTANAGVTGFSTSNPIIPITSTDQASTLGISLTASSWMMQALYYHISEAFRINPNIVLWVGIYQSAGVGQDFSEVKLMQNFSEGTIRQIGVYNPYVQVADEDLSTLQGIATALESQFMPLSILYAPSVSPLGSLVAVQSSGRRNLSVVISQDGAAGSIGYNLFYSLNNTSNCSVSNIGLLLGIVSLAAVNEDISWVKKFPSGLSTPAFSDGTLVKNVDAGVLNDLDGMGYLFLLKYQGYSDSYFNDSWTLDLPTSDYCYIERERTMDKATRGIRTYLIPEMGGDLTIDASTGKLSADTVSYLELVAGYQLEDMAKAGELSGYSVVVDPNQNVLENSEVAFNIVNVATGSMRQAVVNINYGTSD
jgi:hypothetical protein